MRMNTVAMHRWLGHSVAGGENSRTASSRIAMLGYHDDLIFWLLFDQAKSSNSIQQKEKE
jgi:hypothetical protein